MADKHRKLIVCCDGTWNEPYQVGAPTNVVKMARAIRPTDDDGVAQMVYYHPGVGTGNTVDRFMGGTMGLGLSQNVQACYDFLATNFVDGDKIYLFGFSRGAYTARSIAGLIGAVGGLLENRDMDLFPFLFDIYRSREHRKALAVGTKKATEAAIRAVIPEKDLGRHFERLRDAILANRPTPIFFIGVWDTVGAMGIPLGWARWIGKSKYDFHDTELSERIRYAYHALAIDERRKSFAPTLWTRPKGRGEQQGVTDQTLEQVWFAGAHSNVGGGYEDQGLSDIAFMWMVEKAIAARWTNDKGLPLAFDEPYLQSRAAHVKDTLYDSSEGLVWALSGRADRPMFAPQPKDPVTGAEKETCESVHWSARFRFECEDKTLFAPFPYRPRNLEAALGKSGCQITDLSELERKYRAWPEDAATPADEISSA